MSPNAPSPTAPAWRFEPIRIDRINVPAEALRRDETVPDSVRAELEDSIATHGILVPLKVRPLGRSKEFSLIDGSRRLAACRALGWSGDTEVPAIVVATGGSDERDVIEQIHVNQLRQRLDPVAEAEGLRRLVDDLDWTQREAAAALGKHESWASKVMAVWRLPAKMVRDLRAGKFGLAHALILAAYRDEAKLLKYLHEEALQGCSSRELEAKAVRLAGQKVADPGRAGEAFDVRDVRAGSRSRFRIEPGKRSRRVEITIDDEDDWIDVLEQVRAEMQKIRA